MLVLWAAFGALSSAFACTDGLAYPDPPIPITHVRELQSSGSNDDLCIEMGVLFGACAVIWGVLRARRRLGGADVAVNAALVAAQVVYLFAIEAGSLQETISRDRNWVLGAWLFTLAALVAWVAVTALTALSASESDGATAPH